MQKTTKNKQLKYHKKDILPIVGGKLEKQIPRSKLRSHKIAESYLQRTNKKETQHTSLCPAKLPFKDKIKNIFRKKKDSENLLITDNHYKIYYGKRKLNPEGRCG